MNRGLRLFFVASVLAMASRATIGCATNDDGTQEVAPPPPGEDGSTTTPVPLDGSIVDAARDADAAAATCSADGWCYSTLPEAGSYDASAVLLGLQGIIYGLRSVWVGPDNQPWAVSISGHVLHWDGTTWQVAFVAGQPLDTVWGWGTTDIWVAGEQGLVLHGTIAGGAVTFQKITIATTQTISRIVGTSATDVWAIAYGLQSFGTLNRVFRLNAAGTQLVPTTVPGSFTDSTAKLRLSALWTAGTDVWTAGYETTCGGPGKCNFADGLVAIKWTGGADGGADGGSSWDHIPLLRNYTNLIPAGTATSDGVQLVAIRGGAEEGFVARIAGDESKLDAGPADVDSGIVQAGPYAWTNELAEDLGTPEGLWATTRNDIWLVGHGGVVRHFDGKGWHLVRLSLTNVTPLLANLYGIHAVIAPSGEQHIWIVGDDVAIHRTVNP